MLYFSRVNHTYCVPVTIGDRLLC